MAATETPTLREQRALELRVAEIYEELATCMEGEERDEQLLLLRDRHARFLAAGLGHLPAGFVSLDASRPWIVYWALHGLALLGLQLDTLQGVAPSRENVLAFLAACQHPTGGFGGGPGQLAHLAPTYAAVGALLTLGGRDALDIIDRGAMFEFLCRMAVPPKAGGGFRMHEGGECDARSCYTALAVASSLRLDVPALLQRSGCVDYLRRCQTYEGGLGGEPGNEAHGGYTYCGLAALVLAGAPHVLDLQALLRWAVQRQGSAEGGFNGRTNKLVDGCYSFWQGGVFPLLQQLLQTGASSSSSGGGGGGRGGSSSSDLKRWPACSGVPTYAPDEPPSHWRKLETAEGAAGQPDVTAAVQSQPLDLPLPLPDLSRVQGPVQQAEADAERAGALYDQLATAALSGAGGCSSSGNDGSSGDGGVGGGGAAQERRRLLQRAQEAQQAAERADEAVALAAVSAAVLYPVLPGQSTGAEVGSATGSLYNSRALQCWVLRACQQLKGGLRDKPGKPPDYYHTCYCLSGLSSAQHLPGSAVLHALSPTGGSGVLGPPTNELARADPLLNVLEERLQAATAHFSSEAVPELPPLGSTSHAS